MVLRKQEQKLHRLLLGLALLSCGMLGAAFWFEYVEGLAPCKMCIWQRWPHAVVMLAGLLSFTALRPSMLIGAVILALMATGGIGLYHAGVEAGLFAGPDSCTAGLSPATLSETSLSEGLDALLNTPLVRCDEVVWSLFGLSMAAWNGLISLGGAGLAFMLYRRI